MRWNEAESSTTAIETFSVSDIWKIKIMAKTGRKYYWLCVFARVRVPFVLDRGILYMYILYISYICRRTESKNGKARPDNKEWALERCETLASIEFLKLHKNSIGEVEMITRARVGICPIC